MTSDIVSAIAAGVFAFAGALFGAKLMADTQMKNAALNVFLTAFSPFRFILATYGYNYNCDFRYCQ